VARCRANAVEPVEDPSQPVEVHGPVGRGGPSAGARCDHDHLDVPGQRGQLGRQVGGERHDRRRQELDPPAQPDHLVTGGDEPEAGLGPEVPAPGDQDLHAYASWTASVNAGHTFAAQGP
jgi:hypothetical protein